MSVKRVVPAILALAVMSSIPPLLASDGKHGGARVIKVEVAENGSRFAPDSEPVHGDGLPAYGGEFITEGYLYPAGTLTCTANACNGVLPNGDPEFPDKVMGTWTCRGWHVGDGAHTATGPVAMTTQTFDLGSMPGSRMIVTDGFEYADFDRPFRRAVIGGTGPYRNARGEQVQEFLGWNDSVGTTQRMELRVSRH